MADEYFAVVLVRGLIGVDEKIKATLKMLHLTKKNTCVVVKKTPSIVGMIRKVKDYVTYGTLDDATLKQLEKLPHESEKAHDEKKEASVILGVYRLPPPQKGYGRKGIKVPFSMGGALGNRKEKINDLLQRMMKNV